MTLANSRTSRSESTFRRLVNTVLLRSNLSFGFAINRSLAVCISQLQNKGRSHRPWDKVGWEIEVTSVNDEYFVFYAYHTGDLFSIDIEGQLRSSSAHSTIVGGEVRQRLRLLSALFFLLCIIAFSYYLTWKAGFLLTTCALFIFLVEIYRLSKINTRHVLVELRAILDEEFRTTIKRKAL